MISLDAVMLFIWKIRVEGECWIWCGPRRKSGYGAACLDGKQMPAHRASLLVFRGVELPKGCSEKVVDHLCRNRACVRPDHLEVVTPKVNSHRGLAGPRTHCVRGHEYTTLNITRNPSGSPKCRTCLRIKRGWPADRIAAALRGENVRRWPPQVELAAFHREGEEP